MKYLEGSGFLMALNTNIHCAKFIFLLVIVGVNL